MVSKKTGTWLRMVLSNSHNDKKMERTCNLSSHEGTRPPGVCGAGLPPVRHVDEASAHQHVSGRVGDTCVSAQFWQAVSSLQSWATVKV